LQDNYVVHGRLLIAITVVACAGSVRSGAVGSAPSHRRSALWGDLEPGVADSDDEDDDDRLVFAAPPGLEYTTVNDDCVTHVGGLRIAR
jgi:hypothetical protein